MSFHACKENAMSITSRITHVALALALSCLATTAAGIQRTFVSSGGVDSNRKVENGRPCLWCRVCVGLIWISHLQTVTH